MVAGFTGLRRRVDRDSIQRFACVSNEVPGVVVWANCSLELIPCCSMYSRTFWRAIVRVGQTPSVTVLRMRPFGVSNQTRPYAGVSGSHRFDFACGWYTFPV